jgi:hypothetical protein
MCKLPWCGLCYANLKGRSAYKGHRYYRSPNRTVFLREDPDVLKRASKEKAAAGLPMAEDAELQTLCPTLYDFLTMTVWPDKAARKVGTIMIVAEGGRWKAWVHDGDGKRSAWVSSESFNGLLAIVDKELSEDSLGWRPDKR